MEAFACGLVPIISNSRRSATGQFALGPRNLFRSGSPSSLAERIDSWIDDPAALDAASDTYARYAELYAVDRSVKAIERVYARAGDHQRHRRHTPAGCTACCRTPSSM